MRTALHLTIALLMQVSATPSCIESQRRAADAGDTSIASETADSGATCAEEGAELCSADTRALLRCVDGRWSVAEACESKRCTDLGEPGCRTVVGNSTCRQVLVCLGECTSQSDPACVSNCIFSGTSAAQSDARDLDTCLDDSECDGSLACLPDCIDKLRECFYPKRGSESCEQVLGCLADCSSEGCPQRCVEEGDSEAQRRYVMLEMCVLYKCGPEPSTDCVERELTSQTGCWYYFDRCRDHEDD